MEDSCTGVILAGGLNRRLGGRPKAQLKVGGKRILERVMDVFAGIFPRILLVTNEPEGYLDWDLTLVTDIHPVRASLTGLHAGLFYTRTPYAFFSACDAPFLNPSLVRAVLAHIRPTVDVVLPVTAKGREPLVAAYSRRCLGPIERQLACGDLKIDHFFRKVRVSPVTESQLRQVDPELASFFNVNTPQDLKAACHRAGAGTAGDEIGACHGSGRFAGPRQAPSPL
jgi:molybdopterin-guanine dinucleotide biosynthesis protein A